MVPVRSARYAARLRFRTGEPFEAKTVQTLSKIHPEVHQQNSSYVTELLMPMINIIRGGDIHPPTRVVGGALTISDELEEIR